MLRLTNTLTRRQEEVRPLERGLVKMYSCGPTVYRYAHVGNLRTFLLSDLIRRVLEYHGLQVRVVMNITDVGHMTDEVFDAGQDRMLLAAEDEGLAPEEIAAKYTQAFFEDTAAVNIKPAWAYPKASEHIPLMIELIQKLIERGHAYEEHGTVYYDVTTFPDYGKLSGQSLEDMRPGHRIANVDHHKRHHQDFVLWKAAGPRRVVVFDSPWGKGYPGWHIECSAMSLHYLGDRFDIHTGGVDLRFPHHEDEIAQSEGAVGHRVVSIWVHGDHLLMGQLKMAKSAGNVVTIRTLTQAGHDPLAFRYLCFTARYRRQIGFTEEALAGAETALRRLRQQVLTLRAPGAVAAPPTDADLRARVTDPRALAYQQRFLAALDDDLDLPQAITVVHEAVADPRLPPEVRRTLVASWDHVLGLDLVPAPAEEQLPPELAELVAERDRARAARDFARADQIRSLLREKGIELIDTPAGTVWRRA